MELYKVRINNFLSVHNIKMSTKIIKFGIKKLIEKNSIHLNKLFH